MGHVHQENRTHLLGHFGKKGKVDVQTVSRGTRDDELGAGFMGFFLHGRIVNLFLVVQAITHRVEPLAAHVECHAVAQMAAFGQAHAHEGVAGF